MVSSLKPGKCDCNFKQVIFLLILAIDITSGELILQDLIYDKSTLVQVMAL